MAQFDFNKFTVFDQDRLKDDFELQALEIFHRQAMENRIYKSYIETLGVKPARIRNLASIPFLPISFFKSHEVCTGEFEPMVIFESSGTTGTAASRHLVKDTGIYEKSFLECFELFYGPVSRFCILGLLPSYLERSHSSLVYMVNRLIHESGHPGSGFYLHEHGKLNAVLEDLEKNAQPTILFGVGFALLDFAQSYPMPLKHTFIIETGGMKGRKKEMIREELHQVLKVQFSLDAIHSEYGMTELLSQAYSHKNGIFHCPPWMQVCIRFEDDPFTILPVSRITNPGSGLLNIIDLANLHSCSFIATDDAGKLYPDGSFEVLGRADNSDLRGCSLLSI